MKHVALQDAKARIGQMVEALDGPVVITRNGRSEAVLLPAKPKSGTVVQGKRGATGLYDVLRAAPFPLELKPLRGKFRPAGL
jgi:prevent-host-death family protein